MRFIFATVLFVASVLAFMQGSVLLSVVLVVAFSLRYSAFIFIPTAIILDGYYGSYFTVPALSIGAVGWYMVLELLRPKLAELVF